MNFGEALQALKEGKKVTRSIWGGYWYLAKDVVIMHAERSDGPNGCGIPSVILAVLKNGGIAIAQPYQEDLLSDDWQIVE